MESWTPISAVTKIVGDVKASFKTDKTQSVAWRKEQLKQIWRMLDDNEADLQKALFLDMGKPKLEAQLFEMALVKNEIIHFLKDLDLWLAPEVISVPEPFQFWQPTVHKQPKGTVLIIAPWNYPICLTMLPLVAAIAAGNTAVIKPSELAPHASAKIAELIPKYLDNDCVRVVTGDKGVVTELLKHPFGHIIYTGSTPIGKIIMAAAAKNLTPVTLELGGKSPVIVSDKADIALAAKRITWGKYFNAGQTCMCPDYALVQQSVMDEFVEALKKEIAKTYGGNDGSSKIGRIVNKSHFERLTAILSTTNGTIHGGQSDAESLFIAPTLVTDLNPTDIVFASELFGPILPILPYNTLSEARSLIASISETPLGLYIMTEDPTEAEYMRIHTSSGGMAINDVMAHVAVTSLPFGGFGESGMGNYRGKAGVDTFSHRKSVATVSTGKEFEELLEWRYATGDLETKYRFFKENLEPKLE